MARRTKEQIKEWLLARDVDSVLEWASAARGAYRVLNGLTFSSDALLRWRAIEAMGRFAAQKAADSLAPVEDIITRLLWLMNDESGGTGWHSPEAIGEILRNVPVLIPKLAMHLPHFFKEEPFERGTYWAVMRASAVVPEAFAELAEPGLKEGLGADDPYIRAFAARALQHIGKWDGVDQAKKASLATDETKLSIYDHESGDLKEMKVRDFAAQ
ncbi:MAG: DVU0298 family protein [Planctomycetota bacterium]